MRGLFQSVSIHKRGEEIVSHRATITRILIGVGLFTTVIGVMGAMLGFHNMDLAQNLSRLAMEQGSIVHDITVGGSIVSLPTLYINGASLLLRSVLVAFGGVILTCISCSSLKGK